VEGVVEYVAELVDVCAVSSRHSQLLSVVPQRAAGFPTPKAFNEGSVKSFKTKF